MPKVKSEIRQIKKKKELCGTLEECPNHQQNLWELPMELVGPLKGHGISFHPKECEGEREALSQKIRLWS